MTLDHKTNADFVEPTTPLRHDGVTMTCPLCQHPFVPSGRRKYCSDACRSAAYRRRRDAGRTVLTVARSKPRRPITVYECDGCGVRTTGEQRCETCGIFTRKVGLGGQCPHCDEPVTVSELLGQEVPA
jgi:hypothetical protein